MGNQTKESSRSRFIIAGLILSVPLCTLLPYLAVSILLNDIMASLSINYALGGLLMSILTVASGACMFLGSFVQDKIGIRNTLLLAIWLLAAGSALSFLAKSSFAILFMGRVVLGVGFGLNSVALNPFMSTWFFGKQRTFMITGGLIANCLAGTASYLLASPLSRLMGSWNGVFGIYAVFIAIMAVIWTVFGRANKWNAAETMPAQQKEKNLLSGQSNSLLQAARYRQFWIILCMGIFFHAAMTATTAFLPSYMMTELGTEAHIAAGASSANSIASVAGALVGGLAVARTGRRKIFIHIGLLVYMIGGLLITVSHSVPLIFAFSALVGFGFMLVSPAQSTIIMETVQPFSPSVYAAALALTGGLMQFTSLAIAPLFNTLTETMGMPGAFRIFYILTGIAILISFIIRETGPKRMATI